MQTNDFSHLKPAINVGSSTQISSQEFQRKLYAWFEEKGLVSSLRSYLRVLMIQELKNSNCGKIQPKNQFSLSKQAFSLLIAEYLLKEGCHYTLSVFSTEVPSVGTQLPFSLLSVQNKEFRFDRESLVSVLELLGISKETNESVRIVALYSNSEDSLLNCLIKGRTMGAIDLGQVNPEGDYLRNILKELGLSTSLIDEIMKKTQFEKEELERIVCERNHQIRILFDSQMPQKQENKKLKRDLKEAQKRMKQYALKEQTLATRECHLKEKLEEITRKQKNIVKPESCLLKHCDNSCEVISKENGDLKTQLVQFDEVLKSKDVEIEQLRLKVANLTKELQSSKLSIDFLNGCLVRSSQMNLHKTDESSSSQSENSDHLTSDIVRQVRSKLSALELESEELDTRIKLARIKSQDLVIK